MILLKNNLWIYIFFFISFAIFSDPIILEDNFRSIPIGINLDYLEDKENKLTIYDVTSQYYQNKFKKSNVHKLNFGYTKSIYWIKFEIQSILSEKKEIYLEYAYPPIDNVQFYELLSNKIWKIKEFGDSFLFFQREIKIKNYIIQINILPLQNQTYYMRIQTSGSLQIPLKLYNKNSFVEDLNHEKFIYGLYYGIMIVMIMYNTLMFFSLNDRLYIYYVLYLTSFTFFQMTLNGISFEYIWYNYPYFNSLIPFFLACSAIFVNIFSIRFLNINRNHQSKLYFLFTGFIFAMSLLAIVSMHKNIYNFMIQITVMTGILDVALLLIASFVIYFRGYKPARFYILSFTTLLIGVLLNGFHALGSIPTNVLTENTMQIGSALEAILLSFAVADRINYIRKEKNVARNKLIKNQKESIQNQEKLIKSYARFIPEQLLVFLGKDIITNVNLGDSIEKNMTVLFSDIRSFTTLSESMTAEESFSFINDYLKNIAPCIRQYNGYIDKFIGDGIMALFPEKPQDAIDASIEMLDSLYKLNVVREKNGQDKILIGIGIHTGNQVLGVIGENERLEGTVISDVVNTASRLEGLTKAYFSSIIISEDVLFTIKNIEKYKYRYLDTVKVKGKNKAVRIIEIFNGLLPDIMQLKIETKQIFETGIDLYIDKQFLHAKEHFEKVIAINPTDKAAELYLNRCNMNLKFGVDPDWTGIENLDFK